MVLPPFVSFVPFVAKSWCSSGLAARAQFFDDVFERRDDLVLLDPRLLEAEAQVEGLGRWLEREDEVLGPAGIWLCCLATRSLAGRSALACKPLNQCDHLLLIRLADDL